MSHIQNADHLRAWKNIAVMIDRMIRLYPQDRDLRVAFLGYHDIMLSEAEWRDFLGDRVERLDNRPNAHRLAEIHHRPDVTRVPTHRSWLDAMYGPRVQHTVFDFQHYEGGEVLHDFNNPLPDAYRNAFDIVLDIGFSEHVFDYAQCLKNILRMTDVGGLIFHGVPICMVNHGFYGLNPTLFHDFYTDNGGEMLSTALFCPKGVKNGAPVRFIISDEIPPLARFNLSAALPEEGMALWEWGLNCFVRKLEDVDEIINPIQNKYRDTSEWI